MISKETVLSAMSGKWADFYIQYTPLKLISGEWRGSCPVHRGSGPNFAVDKDGQFYCHSQCQEGGDVFAFVQKCDGLTFPEALARVAAFAGVVDSTGSSQRQTPRVIPPAPRPAPVRFLDPVIADDLHKNLMNNDKFRCWLSEHRDLTTETLKRFKVGLLKEDNGIYRTTFPVFDRQGNLTNIRKHLFGYKPELTDQRRKEMRKTLPWGAGLRADLFPMSALERTEEILIVEGEADAALANQLGFSAVTGTLGAGNWRPEWAIHLRGMKKVIILYDLDEAGQIGAQKVAASLSSVVPDVRIAKYPFAQQGGRS